MKKIHIIYFIFLLSKILLIADNVRTNDFIRFEFNDIVEINMDSNKDTVNVIFSTQHRYFNDYYYKEYYKTMNDPDGMEFGIIEIYDNSNCLQFRLDSLRSYWAGKNSFGYDLKCFQNFIVINNKSSDSTSVIYVYNLKKHSEIKYNYPHLILLGFNERGCFFKVQNEKNNDTGRNLEILFVSENNIEDVTGNLESSIKKFGQKCFNESLSYYDGDFEIYSSIFYYSTNHNSNCNFGFLIKTQNSLLNLDRKSNLESGNFYQECTYKHDSAIYVIVRYFQKHGSQKFIYDKVIKVTESGLIEEFVDFGKLFPERSPYTEILDLKIEGNLMFIIANDPFNPHKIDNQQDFLNLFIYDMSEKKFINRPIKYVLQK